MELQDVKKILIVNLGGIGDILLSLPAVRALRVSYPGARIDIMAVERACELARISGAFDGVFVYARRIGKDLPLILRLRRHRYDLIVNMRTMVSWPGALKVFLLLAVIGARKSAGRDTDGRGFFFDIKIPETGAGDAYEAEYDIDTVRALGASVVDRTVRFESDDASAAAVARLLADRGIAGDIRLIGIHAGGVLSRRWGLGRFAEAMALIARSMPCVFVLTGGRDERDYVDALVRIHGVKAVNLAGELTLRQLGALIRRCALYISNDTGPMHIAAALRTPLVAIFGPGHLTRYDPRRISDRAVVLKKETACAPCNRPRCPSLECLKSISPDEVAGAALRLLRGSYDTVA